MGSAWSKCSVTCGEGQQHRNARCWRMMAPGFDSTVHDNLCSGQSRPPLVKPCQEARCGPMWETSEWAEVNNILDHHQTAMSDLFYKMSDNYWKGRGRCRSIIMVSYRSMTLRLTDVFKIAVILCVYWDST